MRTFSTSEFQKEAQNPQFSFFNTFDLENCFAPQRHTLFRHLDVQKWSDHVVFLAFLLGNVLRATTAYTFLASQLPKEVRTHQSFTLLTSKCASCHKDVHFFASQLLNVVRAWCVLCILTWKCASRHNGVHFFDIATSKSGLRP